jgi:hypothetical protein
MLLLLRMLWELATLLVLEFERCVALGCSGMPRWSAASESDSLDDEVSAAVAVPAALAASAPPDVRSRKLRDDDRSDDDTDVAASEDVSELPETSGGDARLEGGCWCWLDALRGVCGTGNETDEELLTEEEDADKAAEDALVVVAAALLSVVSCEWRRKLKRWCDLDFLSDERWKSGIRTLTDYRRWGCWLSSVS